VSENSHAERIEAQLRMAEDEADEEDGGEPSVSIDLTDVPTGRDSTHVALVSGGMDSTVAAAVSQEVARKLDVLAYLDTRTGLEANREYVEELADALGLQLWTLRTHESYAEKVRENGYPGPSRHGMMFNFLKERQISKLATVSHGDLVLWTGVRSHESERRMAHVEGVQEARRWTWVAPIHDWTKQDCQDYLDGRDLPENPLWKTLGRSGDCFCGCFASREELLDLEAEGFVEHADWLRNLDTEPDDETALWAWASLSKTEQRAERVGDDQMTLCSTCALPDGGEST